MTPTETEHDWFNEQIGAYLTHGLSDDERVRFESHMQSCAECAAELEQIKQMEASMTAAFAGGMLASDFEDRVVGRLRFGIRPSRWEHPLVRRIAVAAAIGIVVGAFGYVGKEFLEQGQLPSFALNKSRGARSTEAAGSSPRILTELLGTSQRSNYLSTQSATTLPVPSSPTLPDARITQQRQYVQYSVDNALQHTANALANGNLAESQTAIETARVARNVNPGIVSDEELREFDRRIADAQVLLDQKRATQREAAPATGRLAQGSAIREQSKDDTIAALTREARALTRRGDYNRGLGVLDQILKLDPKNDYALGARELVQDRVTVQQQQNYRDSYDRNIVRQYNVSEEQKIPYSDILRFPGNWPDLSTTRDKTVAFERGERAESQAVAAQLERKLPEVRFENAAFGDVVDFMRDVSLSNIYVDWRSLEAAGINQSTPVSAKLRDVKFDTALKTIASDADKGTGKLEVGVVDGVVTLAARDGKSKEYGWTSTEDFLNKNPAAAAATATGQVTQTAFLIQPDSRFRPSDFSLSGVASDEDRSGADSDGDGKHRVLGGAVVAGGTAGGDFTDGIGVPLSGSRSTGEVTNLGGVVALNSTDAKLNFTNDHRSLAVAQLVGDAPGTQPSQPGGPVAHGAQPQPQTQPAGPVNIRRVIREGVMEFEVDSFDSAFVTLSKIVSEEGGFIAAADSDKLPNGKVRGTITLRVPPDRLDTLVLKLRALGELKSQRLGSKDISKEYTDLESELRAARAMEERLLEMIKTAKGKVAELLEAERELGNWRTRIEKMTGQLNYYNNLVSMATLSITAYEKDIRAAATASQTEEINTGVETDNVEHARTEIIKSIDEAKGRIVESELKQLEAGQLAAKVVAEVAPENAGPIVDRLKQLGRIARLDIQRKQTTDPQAQGTRSLGLLGTPKLETAPTRLVISMYNLANVAPRLTTNLNLAGDDVEAIYRAILKRVGDAQGRVISSSLLRQDATQATGSIQFEVKAAEADAVLNDIRSKGPVQVLRLNVTENPDTANATTAKQAFTVQIIPSAQVEPREKRMLGIETSDVDGAVRTITAAAGSAGGRVLESSLTQDNTGKTIARVAIEVPLGKADQVADAAKQQGKVRTSDSTKNSQVPEGALSRARLYVTFGTGETIVLAEHGVWNSIREGLGTSMRGLMLSLQLIIIGVCLIAPWALLLWGGWKLARRGKRAAATV